MPAKSQAQRAYLNAHFGHRWVKAHHFDNRGKLPGHVKGKAMKGKKAHVGPTTANAVGHHTKHDGKPRGFGEGSGQRAGKKFGDKGGKKCT